MRIPEGRFREWSLIQAVVVIDETRKSEVEHVLADFDQVMRRPVHVKRDWYYH